MEMKKILLRLFLVIAFAAPIAAPAIAQNASPAVASAIFVVDGLTADMRDGLQRDLATRNDLKLVFACVPAGILVFEGHTGSHEQLYDRLTPVLEQRISRQRIVMLDTGRSSVEQQCAEARNR